MSENVAIAVGQEIVLAVLATVVCVFVAYSAYRALSDWLD